MRVKYTGQTNPLILTEGKIYDVISTERGWYRIVPDFDDGEPEDENGKIGYLFPAHLFEIIEEASNDTSASDPINGFIKVGSESVQVFPRRSEGECPIAPQGSGWICGFNPPPEKNEQPGKNNERRLKTMKKLSGFAQEQIWETVCERCEDAEKETAKDRKDAYKAGYAEAWFEIKEIIENRKDW